MTRLGLAPQKQEGHTYCTYCHAEAGPGQDLMHEPWCPPPEPAPRAWSNIWPILVMLVIAAIVTAVKLI